MSLHTSLYFAHCPPASNVAPYIPVLRRPPASIPPVGPPQPLRPSPSCIYFAHRSFAPTSLIKHLIPCIYSAHDVESCRRFCVFFGVVVVMLSPEERRKRGEKKQRTEETEEERRRNVCSNCSSEYPQLSGVSTSHADTQATTDIFHTFAVRLPSTKLG